MADLAGLTVFVLEDQSEIAEHLSDMLSRLQCVVVGPAATFEDADRLLLAGGIDVALIDYKILGQPSFRIADLLRQMHVPFAFMTMHCEAMRRPFNQFPILTKPFSIEGLAAMLRELRDSQAAS